MSIVVWLSPFIIRCFVRYDRMFDHTQVYKHKHTERRFF